MHSFLAICSLLVVGTSAQYLVDPRVIISTPSIAFSSQYHAQDELGQFAFGHRSDTQSREEVKGIDGSVRGAYSYVDPAGKLVHVQYLADHNGFRILGANNLPVAPEVTLEPVKDTPEVVAARAIFAKKFEEEKTRMPEIISRSRRDIFHTSIIPTVLAKTTLKTSELVPVDAKVPAATKLAEIKEKEKEIITPYHLGVASLLHTPVLTSSLVSPSILVKSTEIKPIEEKKEIVPVLTSRLIKPVLSIPVLKTTIKTNELKTLMDVKTPAATRLAEIKEVEKHLISPLTWSSHSLVQSPLVLW